MTGNPSVFTRLALISTLFLSACSDKPHDKASSVWLSFTEENSDLYGFTDEKGNIMIKPQFMGYFSAKKFKNIIGAMTEEDGKISQYYLLKNGTQIGHDSLYITDMKFDCEHEGHIRFRDPYSYNTGLFDSSGRIVLAPEYNELSQVHKDCLFAVRNARKVMSENDTDNHFVWVGGTVDLIKTDGTLLIDSVPRHETLNLHSMSVSDSEPEYQAERIVFKGNDNRYYSFTDNKTSFDIFLKGLPGRTETYLNEKLVVWQPETEWTSTSSGTYWKVNQKGIEDFITYISDSSNTVFINIQNFIPLTDDMYTYFEPYKDDCDNWNSMEYPIFEVSYPYDEDKYRSMYFLKMKEGFRIVAVKFD